MGNGIRYKPGDWVVLSATASPTAWRGRVVRVVPHLAGGFPYRVCFGKQEMGMYPLEIERPATDAEILEYKLTL